MIYKVILNEIHTGYITVSIRNLESGATYFAEGFLSDANIVFYDNDYLDIEVEVDIRFFLLESYNQFRDYYIDEVIGRLEEKRNN